MSFRFPIPDSALALAALSLLAGLLLLSSLSFFFILHLRFKSRTAPHLQGFNTLSAVKLLLVSAVTLWSLSELLLPLISPGLCKLQSVLSLGLLEPAFLITILFLVDISIKNQNPRFSSLIISIIGTCLPLTLLQSFAVYFVPHIAPQLPDYFFLNSVAFGKGAVRCTNPLPGTVVFVSFAVTYFLCFLLSCWRVASIVSNKGLRARIYRLGIGVLIPLAIQVVLLVVSVLLSPSPKADFGWIEFGAFVAPLVCAAMGEGFLVIRPIADALAAGGDCWLWTPRPPVEGKRSSGNEEP